MTTSEVLTVKLLNLEIFRVINFVLFSAKSKYFGFMILLSSRLHIESRLT